MRPRLGARSSTPRRVGASALLLCALIIPTEAWAGGYYIGPVGSKATGRGGAFTARADDLSAVHYNPAGLTFIKRLWLQVDNKSSYHFIEYARAPLTDANGMVTTSFDPVRSTASVQPLGPLVGAGYGIDDWSLAFVSFAKSGVARVAFPAQGPQRYQLIEREATLLNNTLSVAWQPLPGLSVGASLYLIVAPSIEYQLAIANSVFGGLSPVNNDLDLVATIRASDWFVPNAVLGVSYELTQAFELGVSAQIIPAEIRADATLDLHFANDVSAYGIDDPQLGTFRGQSPANDVTLTLPTPLSFRLGARYVHRRADGSELFDIEGNVSYETWSVVDTITLDSNRLQADVAGNQVDIGVIEVEKRWRDTMGISLGGDFAAIAEKLTLRAGAFWESAVADASYAHVDFASGQHLGATLGASLTQDEWSFNVAYEYRVQPEVVNPPGNGRIYQKAPLTPEEAHVINHGAFRAHSHSAVLGVGYGF